MKKLQAKTVCLLRYVEQTGEYGRPLDIVLDVDSPQKAAALLGASLDEGFYENQRYRDDRLVFPASLYTEYKGKNRFLQIGGETIEWRRWKQHPESEAPAVSVRMIEMLIPQ